MMEHSEEYYRILQGLPKIKWAGVEYGVWDESPSLTQVKKGVGRGGTTTQLMQIIYWPLSICCGAQSRCGTLPTTSCHMPFMGLKKKGGDGAEDEISIAKSSTLLFAARGYKAPFL